jgi:hypothetical protein
MTTSPKTCGANGSVGGIADRENGRFQTTLSVAGSIALNSISATPVVCELILSRTSSRPAATGPPISFSDPIEAPVDRCGTDVDGYVTGGFVYDGDAEIGLLTVGATGAELAPRELAGVPERTAVPAPTPAPTSTTTTRKTQRRFLSKGPRPFVTEPGPGGRPTADGATRGTIGGTGAGRCGFSGDPTASSCSIPPGCVAQYADELSSRALNRQCVARA